MDASNFQFLLKTLLQNCCLIIEFSCKAYMTYHVTLVQYDLIDFSLFFMKAGLIIVIINTS